MRSFILLFIFSGSWAITAQKKTLTVNESVLKQRALSPQRTVGFSWVKNASEFTLLSSDYKSILRYTFMDQEERVACTVDEVNKQLPDGAKIQNLYGYEWIAKDEILVNNASVIFTYNVITKSLSLKHQGMENWENVNYHTPSGKCAYTLENNVYMNGKPITKNKDKNIVSGQSIARNEFGIEKGLFWSDKGNFLAFYQKDESEVADYPLLDVTTTPGSLISIKYPMAGQKSEKPRVGIYNFKNKKIIYIKPSGNSDDYLTNFAFTPDEKYCLIAEVNRGQNEYWLNAFDVITGKKVKTLWYESNGKWVEPEHPAYFLGGTNDFLWLSEKDGFMNIYRVNFSGAALNEKQITKHSFVVKDILEVDPLKKLIYYAATGDNPCNTMIYGTDFEGNARAITKNDGVHRFDLSDDGLYYYDGFSSLSIPNREMIYTTNGKMAKFIKESTNPLDDYALGISEIGFIKAKDGSDLYYRMVKPADFDATRKYPVLVYVYGGPHAQMVTNGFNAGANLWMNWLAAQGYLIFTLDNRGSAERGFAFESQIHRRLGDIEMEDQLSGVEFLKSLPYVDAKRLAVHGWSFGGFMTTSLMLRHPGVFNAGVAGGPVTDWKYYEVMYGERYMDRPDENQEGYLKNALTNYTQNLSGKLLLIHGTVDDVVVMQHNYSLIKKFVEDGKQVDFFAYPMHKHNVMGKDRAHLMEKVLTYVIENNR
ncbi:MAG: DPP IV N-terminal domain-containing protein [Bacteroidetes bacterium]|nr:DPP IV N-terminal domain-containing protein [Bacteroidota bacterium]MBM3424269.1 S9 family peptidase [Bacteroidota bacterium]